ncbi:unnamed protein product [Aureobasidium pullulans]|nr:unnamed protein product [Aureobasidium pullulans]
MARVKFNATADYAYLDNFKILSNTFRKHHIDRPIPVEMLVKCKMQDNLEFLQWTKRFWDQHYPGSSGGGAQTAALTQENNALKETVQGLERERDFYFSKLRDIELLVQGAMEAEPELEKDEGGLLKQIQTILYSTEGFEIPAEVDDEEGELIEEETF